MTKTLVYQEPHLLTVQQLANHPRYPWLTQSVLRHHIYNSESRVNSLGETIHGNGLDLALVRIGRRILIDLPTRQVLPSTRSAFCQTALRIVTRHHSM